MCETLANGLPLVLAPIRDDQPIVADQVVRAGAGIRVRFTRVLPAHLREAVRVVLTEPGYHQAAQTIRRSFEAAGGAVAAGDTAGEARMNRTRRTGRSRLAYAALTAGILANGLRYRARLSHLAVLPSPALASSPASLDSNGAAFRLVTVAQVTVDDATVWPETRFDGLDTSVSIIEAQRRGWIERGCTGS